MIDTTMIVMFVQGKEAPRMAKVQYIRRLMSQHVNGGYDADFQGLPTIHARDDHGHWHNFDIEGRTEMRKFGPKQPDHPSIGQPCPVCQINFKAGDYTALETTHAADPEEARKAQAGIAFTAIAAEVHWDCRSQP